MKTILVTFALLGFALPAWGGSLRGQVESRERLVQAGTTCPGDATDPETAVEQIKAYDGKPNVVVADLPAAVIAVMTSVKWPDGWEFAERGYILRHKLRSGYIVVVGDGMHCHYWALWTQGQATARMGVDPMSLYPHDND